MTKIVKKLDLLDSIPGGAMTEEVLAEMGTVTFTVRVPFIYKALIMTAARHCEEQGISRSELASRCMMAGLQQMLATGSIPAVEGKDAVKLWEVKQ